MNVQKEGERRDAAVHLNSTQSPHLASLLQPVFQLPITELAMFIATTGDTERATATYQLPWEQQRDSVMGTGTHITA